MSTLPESPREATIALPAEEQQELTLLESVIERGKQTFVEVGTALCRIRDSRLYRATHGSFQCYCEERWNFSRVQAHRLIEAANVVALLPIGNTSQITNEAQARALARVPQAKRVEVLQKAVKDSKPITAKTITAAAARVTPSPVSGGNDREPFFPTPFDEAENFEDYRRIMKEVSPIVSRLFGNNDQTDFRIQMVRIGLIVRRFEDATCEVMKEVKSWDQLLEKIRCLDIVLNESLKVIQEVGTP